MLSIHQRVAREVGLTEVAHVENHHNFAWRETLPDGTSVVVHRKGATPAGAGHQRLLLPVSSLGRLTAPDL
jgi:RNA-splicing ligase RtcB